MRCNCLGRPFSGHGLCESPSLNNLIPGIKQVNSSYLQVPKTSVQREIKDTERVELLEVGKIFTHLCIDSKCQQRFTLGKLVVNLSLLRRSLPILKAGAAAESAISLALYSSL